MRKLTVTPQAALIAHQERSRLITDIAVEIEQAVDALQLFIEKHDDTGSIKYLSRVMLKRLAEVAEAALMAHDSGNPQCVDDELYAIAHKTVYGTEPAKEDDADDQLPTSGAVRQPEAPAPEKAVEPKGRQTRSEMRSHHAAAVLDAQPV